MMSPESPHTPFSQKFLSLLVTVLTPVILILVVVRSFMFPWYPEFEYRTPGFPDDPYGFTLEERLHWAKLSIAYLVNNEGIDYLRDLTFPSGQQIPEPSCSLAEDCSRLYNERELGHMIDVKNLVGIANVVMWASLAAVALAWQLAQRGGWLDSFKLALGRGGLLTLALMGAILLLVVAAWGLLFTGFHEVFFEPGTWSFYYSDTLIRLFPERFWRDTFLYVGILPSLLGVLLWLRWGRRK